MMTLPEDPMMLLSFINMKLRDEYENLEALCEDMQQDSSELTARLSAAGFEYDPTHRRFW